MRNTLFNGRNIWPHSLHLCATCPTFHLITEITTASIMLPGLALDIFHRKQLRFPQTKEKKKEKEGKEEEEDDEATNEKG